MMFARSTSDAFSKATKHQTLASVVPQPSPSSAAAVVVVLTVTAATAERGMSMSDRRRETARKQYYISNWNRMISVVVALITATSDATATYRSDGVGHCSFPVTWHGTWYEADVGRVTVMASDVIGKGTCVDSEDSFYLLENRTASCYQCLVITQRHVNVLQYKQSFCVDKDTISNICTSIHGETIYRTLIRDLGSSIACPFHAAFHFIYTNNSGGFCTNPVSYIKPCSSSSHLKFHFKPCSNVAYTYQQEWSVECLASWRDGAQSLLIGRYAESSAFPAEEKFRCFMYRAQGTVVYLSMSVDGSCRGLRSPRDGPVVLELTEDTFGWPKSQCTFPAFVTRVPWRNLASNIAYRANDMGDVIDVVRETAAFAQRSDTSALEKRMVCYALSDVNSTTAEQFVVEAFIIDGCKSEYQCLKFIKKVEGVLEIHEGRRNSHATGSCATMHTSSDRRLLITEVVTARSCPLEGGRFPVRIRSTGNCQTFLRSGCNGSSIIDLIDTCSTKPVLQLECLRKWRDGRNRYVIARPLGGDSAGLITCWSFRRKLDSLLFSVDSTCNEQTIGRQQHVTSYVINPQALTCDALGVIVTRSPANIIGDDVVTEAARVDNTGRHADQSKRSRDYRTSARSSASSKANTVFWLIILSAIFRCSVT